MPQRRCLDCNRLTKTSPCPACRSARKRKRNEHAKILGPCPQNVACALCPVVGALPKDPMTWGHVRAMSRNGPPIARPVHRSCNSREGTRAGSP